MLFRSLLAYYQGKIRAEDIYPPPPGEGGRSEDSLPLANQDVSAVDTSRIQSYQIREFVEALRGIEDDLKNASTATETAMKLAVLGEVSPLAIAREVVRAVEDGRRSPIAAGFQLVEILASLKRAERLDVAEVRARAWRQCLVDARAQVAA